MSGLPNGWADATVGEVTVPYATIDPTREPLAEFTYVDIGSIDNSTQTITEPKVFLGREAPSRARRVIRSGDILFSTVRTYLKNIAIVPRELDGKLTSTGIAVLRPAEGIDGRYLFHWVKSDEFVSNMSHAQDGTLYPAVTDKDVAGARIPVAPLAEQLRIVAVVDNLTARTARASKELGRIPDLIARYKGAILAMAFSGLLTKHWREDRGRQDTDDEILPSGWSILPLGQISQIQGGIQVGKKRSPSADLVEVPYLRVANVQRGWLNLDEIKTIAVTAEERDRLLLRDGDILMNEGGDRDKLGRGWVWRSQIPVCIHQNHVFRIRLSDAAFPPEFVSHFANENGQQYFIDQGKQTTNLASISKTKVAALPVPIPPTDEAVEIVRLIESAFAWLDRVAADHTATARLLAKLEAAIIAKAFRGQLTTQNPDDEPATVLLDRIKAMRTAAPNEKRQVRPPSELRDIEQMPRNIEEVLAEAKDWVSAQEAFERCGMSSGATTEQVEQLYAELRELDKAGRLETEPVTDELGRKLHDLLRLKAA